MNLPKWPVMSSETAISIIVLTIFAAMLIALFAVKIDINPQIADFLKIVGGAVTAKFGTVVDYHLGSSSGSRSKDELLANSTPQNPPQ